MWASSGQFPWEARQTSFITGKIAWVQWFLNEANVNQKVLINKWWRLYTFATRQKIFWATLWSTVFDTTLFGNTERQYQKTIRNITSENLPRILPKWLMKLFCLVLGWTLEPPSMDTKCWPWPCWLITADSIVECHIHAPSKETAILRSFKSFSLSFIHTDNVK